MKLDVLRFKRSISSFFRVVYSARKEGILCALIVECKIEKKKKERKRDITSKVRVMIANTIIPE